MQRFSTLAKYLPFLPVFGGGVVRFQSVHYPCAAKGLSDQYRPVYAGDVARAVEICCRSDPKVVEQVGGKVIEAGGPDGQFAFARFLAQTFDTLCIDQGNADNGPVFTYREIMQLVLRFNGLQGRRLIISLPYWVGMIQGWLLEKLPESLFTVTRDQVRWYPTSSYRYPLLPLNLADQVYGPLSMT